ncbi:hypothetical protein Tco_0577447, partial [Tanacetum coccineum]
NKIALSHVHKVYERKKLKKGQTQGEVGDVGQVKENVMEKKKVKVVEPKDAQSSG